MRCFKENPDDSEGIGYVFLPSYADMDETEVDILAGMLEIALIGSLLLTIIIFILDRLPLAKTAMILVVNGMQVRNRRHSYGAGRKNSRAI